MLASEVSGFTEVASSQDTVQSRPWGEPTSQPSHFSVAHTAQAPDTSTRMLKTALGGLSPGKLGTGVQFNTAP